MPRFFNPHLFDIALDIGHMTIRVFLNDNLCVKSTETCSVPHCHKEYEMRYFESGTSCYTVGDAKYICNAGDYLLIPPGIFHAQLDNDNPDMEGLVQYNLRFTLLPEATQSPESRGIAVCPAVPRLIHTDHMRIELLLHVLTEEIYDKQTGYLFAVKHILAAVLVEMPREISPTATQLFPDETRHYHNRMRMAIDEYFTYWYLEQISVGDLARKLDMPVRQVAQAVREIYGMPFSRKLREMRVEAAKVLLRTTDQRISDIAAACGFDTYSYFYSSFKKLEGVTPCEYRENNRRDEKSPA